MADRRHLFPERGGALAMADDGRLGYGPLAIWREHAAGPPATAMRPRRPVPVDQAWKKPRARAGQGRTKARDARADDGDISHAPGFRGNGAPAHGRTPRPARPRPRWRPASNDARRAPHPPASCRWPAPPQQPPRACSWCHGCSPSAGAGSQAGDAVIGDQQIDAFRPGRMAALHQHGPRAHGPQRLRLGNHGALVVCPGLARQIGCFGQVGGQQRGVGRKPAAQGRQRLGRQQAVAGFGDDHRVKHHGQIAPRQPLRAGGNHTGPAQHAKLDRPHVQIVEHRVDHCRAGGVDHGDGPGVLCGQGGDDAGAMDAQCGKSLEISPGARSTARVGSCYGQCYSSQTRLLALITEARRRIEREFARCFTVPYAGVIRIRFDGLAFASQPTDGAPQRLCLQVNSNQGRRQGPWIRRYAQQFGATKG